MFLFDPQKNLRYCLHFITEKRDAEKLSYLTFSTYPETVNVQVDTVSDLKLSFSLFFKTSLWIEPDVPSENSTASMMITCYWEKFSKYAVK